MNEKAVMVSLLGTNYDYVRQTNEVFCELIIYETFPVHQQGG